MNRKKILTNLALLFATILVASVVTEFILRAKGYRPWRPQKIDVKVKSGREMYSAHPRFGYIHEPGQFTVVLPTSYSFEVTHTDAGLRVTHPPAPRDSSEAKPEIWIFGCSLTYGWTLNDKETYPWLLQEALPDYEIVNFGVNGFGTVHSFLQFQEALENGRKPRLVVLAYASFHDIRNTFARERKKGLVSTKRHPLVQPFARFNADGDLVYGMSTDGFYEFPLMRVSALVHLIEQTYNIFEARGARGHDVSRAIIKEFARLCEANEISFVLAGIFRSGRTSDMLRYAREQSISTVDISVDLGKPGYRNLPHDSHPSAKSNREYAEKLSRFLSAALEHRSVSKR